MAKASRTPASISVRPKKCWTSSRHRDVRVVLWIASPFELLVGVGHDSSSMIAKAGPFTTSVAPFALALSVTLLKCGGGPMAGSGGPQGGASASCGTTSSNVGGVSSCGAGESCCTSLNVVGGTFLRSYDGATFTDASHPATVSTFRLDKYEVTVGRFRRFVEAVVAGWGPPNGA